MTDTPPLQRCPACASRSTWTAPAVGVLCVRGGCYSCQAVWTEETRTDRYSEPGDTPERPDPALPGSLCLECDQPVTHKYNGTAYAPNVPCGHRARATFGAPQARRR